MVILCSVEHAINLRTAYRKTIMMVVYNVKLVMKKHPLEHAKKHFLIARNIIQGQIVSDVRMGIL